VSVRPAHATGPAVDQRRARRAWALARGQAFVPAAVVAAVACPYLLLLGSPLRLAGDEIAYLRLASALSDGRPLPTTNLPIHFPLGYPRVLAGLDRIGFATAPGFVGLNLVLLGAAVAAAYGLLRREFRLGRWAAALGCCLVLLSRNTVSTASTALTDIPFLAVAMTYLLLLSSASRTRGRAAWVRIAAAALLAGAGVELRTIGIALLPPLAWAAAAELRVADRFRRVSPTRRAAIGALALLTAAAVVSVALVAGSRAGYLHAAGVGWHTDRGVRGVAGQVVPQAKKELAKLGELAVNVGEQRVPNGIGRAYPLFGALALAVAVLGASSRRRSLSAVDVYAVSLGAVVFVWPGYDSRLLLPILPVLIGYAALAVRHAPRVPAAALAAAAVCVFAAVGAGSLERSVRIAVSGRHFADEWAREAPRYAATYRVAFTPGARVDRRKVDPTVLRLLRRYDARAASLARQQRGSELVGRP
jgi:hypothetical protein